MDPYVCTHDDYTISTDRERFDVDVFHRYLAEEAYWAKGRARSTTDIALEASLVFGAYEPGGSMVGAARVVTDWITFGWLCDVFVLEGYRGRGLGRALVSAVVTHPGLSPLKRILLATGDAHGLYEAYGFTALRSPEMWMERNGPIV